MYFKKIPVTASLTINKYETNETTQLEDATFRLVSSDALLNDVTAGSSYIRHTDDSTITFTTTTDPITFDNLPIGSYTLTEVTAPSGYERADAISFTVDSDGTVYLDDDPTTTITSITVYDEPVTCTLTVSKSYVSENGNALTAGVDDLVATFTLTSDSSTDTPSYSETIDITGEGTIEFTGLAYNGTYILSEASMTGFEDVGDITIEVVNGIIYVDNNEIVQIVIEYVTIDGQGIYNLVEGINDSILDEYLLTYIRESGIIIKISTADGWHIDGVMVAKTAEITITKTFSGLNASQVETILDNFNMPLTIGADSKTGERQEYVTLYPDTSVSGVYDYEGQVGSTQSYVWVLNAITNEEYTLIEQDYELSGYDVTTLAVLYYTDEYGNTQYVQGWTTTSDDLSEVITGGTTTAFSFNNFYTPEETGVLAIIKTDESGVTLSGATFTQ